MKDISIPLEAFLEQVKKQREASYDEAAQWRAVADQLAHENAALREENERLRSTSGE